MVIRNMMSIDAVDGDSFVASNEPAKSKAVTINFQHRELMISGVMTWYEVDEPKAFKEHERDFEAIQNFVPLVSAMIDEFREDEFLISECPGKEGRGCATPEFACSDTVTSPKVWAPARSQRRSTFGHS